MSLRIAHPLQHPGLVQHQNDVLAVRHEDQVVGVVAVQQRHQICVEIAPQPVGRRQARSRIKALTSGFPVRSTCRRDAMVARRWPGASSGTGLSRHSAASIFRYGHDRGRRTRRSAKPAGSTWSPPTRRRCCCSCCLPCCMPSAAPSRSPAAGGADGRAWRRRSSSWPWWLSASRPASCRCTSGCPARTRCAPSHVSAVMSGVLIKMGIYGIVRIPSLLPEPPPGGGSFCWCWAWSRESWAWPLPSASTISSGCWPITASRTSASS